jgi:hypothetical protein
MPHLEEKMAETAVPHRQIAMHFSFALGSSTTDNLGFRLGIEEIILRLVKIMTKKRFLSY